MNPIKRTLLRSAYQLGIVGVLLVSALRPAIAHADAASLLTALEALKSHIKGNITLTTSVIEANKLTIDANGASFASSSAIISASLDLVRTYDAVLGPLWVSRSLPARSSVTNDIHFTLYTAGCRTIRLGG